MDRNSLVKIGYVMKTHGLKGEVTLNLSPDSPELIGVNVLIIEHKNGLVPHFVESTAFNGNKVFLKLEGVDSIDHSSELKGCSVFIEKSSRPKLKRGEFYNDELIGFQVWDKTNGDLGQVGSIITQGLTKLIEVGERGILIPVNGPFITSISKAKKKIEVELPEGFLDI
jgi:16S rRNA processing protein RimM